MKFIPFTSAAKQVLDRHIPSEIIQYMIELHLSESFHIEYDTC